MNREGRHRETNQGTVRRHRQEDSEDTATGDRVGSAKGEGGAGVKQRTARTGASNVDSLHRKWSSDQNYRTAYEEMVPEFDLARSIISSRTAAGLTQAQLAERMNTTQSVVTIYLANHEREDRDRVVHESNSGEIRTTIHFSLLHEQLTTDLERLRRRFSESQFSDSLSPKRTSSRCSSDGCQDLKRHPQRKVQ